MVPHEGKPGVNFTHTFSNFEIRVFGPGIAPYHWIHPSTIGVTTCVMLPTAK